MKVIAINGSPRKEGNTYASLKIVAKELETQGIEVEMIQIGSKVLRGCTACNSCVKNQNEKCIIDDGVNEVIQKMKNADGLLLGSPVHYAGIGAMMKAFLDRAFFVASVNGSLFRHKVGASVVAVRRSGGLPTFNNLNSYINYSEMLMPSSNYWGVIHGLMPNEINEDAEGLQVMRLLGQNMAWLMKLVENGQGTVTEPEGEDKIFTHFVR